MHYKYEYAYEQNSAKMFNRNRGLSHFMRDPIIRLTATECFFIIILRKI